jgi:pimeloyl-ACP methyl ester carboxylesterase
MCESEPQFLAVGEGAKLRRIAVRAQCPFGAPAGLLWLSGFKSDMSGSKAAALAAWAERRGYACARFDYSGNGLSEGRFEDGSIGGWLDEAEAVFRRFAGAALGIPLVLIGSSMGGYLALLLLRRLLETAPDLASRIGALVLIAPAWDMTEALLWNRLADDDRRRLLADGVWPLPSAYGDPIPVTRTLIEEGRAHLIGTRPLHLGRPAFILQGLCDPDVPPDHTRALAEILKGGRVEIVEIADGGHSLSRPEDIAVLLSLVERAIAQALSIPEK